MWHRLVLRGFGCYREEKALELEEGLNVYIAPNEEGKSTLIMGLVAVLYGLPGTSDPARFGKARYQNWDEAREFGGELEFSVDGQDYRLRRDFTTDRVALVRREGSGWAEIAGGEHRTRARRVNLSYTEAITGLIGLGTPELFTSTFCLSQPLVRANNLDAEIMRLLSGAAGSYQEALESLSASLKELTRYTRDLGVTAGNQRSDRRLELLEQEISSLEETVKGHRQVLDAFPALQAELAELAQKHVRLSGVLKEREAALRSWGEWRALRLRYQNFLAEQTRLEQARERATDLARRESELRRELAAVYPELESATAEVGDTLASLKELEEKITGRKEEIAALNRSLAARTIRIEELKQRLREEFAAVDGRPDLLPRHQELLLRKQRQDEMAGRLAAARETAARAEAQLAEIAPWGELGSAPTSLLPERRRLAQALVAEWQDDQGAGQEMKALEAELAGDLAWFEQATPEAREACRDYPRLKERLAWKRQRVEADLARARTRLEEHEAARQAWQREFGILADLDAEAAGAIATKLSLLDAKRRAEEEVAAAKAAPGRKPVWRRPWAWMAVAAVLLLSLALWPLAVAAATAAGIWFWHDRRRQVRERELVLAAFRQRLSEKEKELAGLEERHPFLSAWSAAELIRAQERWLLCRSQAEALEARARDLPTAREVAALEAALAQARAEEESLEELTAGARTIFADVPQAHTRWQAARERRDEVRNRRAAWAQKEFDYNAEDVSTCPLAQAGERWQELARMATVTGTACHTVAELASWLAGLDEAWWREAMAQARAWERAATELARAREVEAEITGRGQDGMSPLERLEAALNVLRQESAPFDEHTRPADLQRLIKECQDLRSQLGNLETLSQEEAGRLGTLGAELEAWQKQRETLAARVGPVLAAGDGQVETALRRWQDFQQRQAEAEGLARDLTTLLAGQEVATMEELRRKATDAANQAAQTLVRWQEMVATHPGLPEASLREDLETAYQPLEREVAELAAQVEDAARQIEARRLRQAEIMGVTPINLAAAGEQLAQLRQEREQVKLEAEALTLAYQELRLAAEEFQASHRERLAGRATEHFTRLSGVTGRQVMVDEGFHLYLNLENGQTAEVIQLSQGAQDQLYLALRLAIADLLSSNLVLPFIFDDPFLNFDEHRLEFARQTVQRLSAERQVLLLSHRREFAGWKSQCG